MGQLGHLLGQINQTVALQLQIDRPTAKGLSAGVDLQINTAEQVTLLARLQGSHGLQIHAHAHGWLVQRQQTQEGHIKGLARDQRAGGQVGFIQRQDLAGLTVFVVHAGVGHLHALYGDLQRLTAVVILRLGLGAGIAALLCCCAILRADRFPVAHALIVAHQLQLHVVQNHIAHAHLTAQQRQHLDAQPQGTDLGQRLGGVIHRRHANVF